MMITKSFNKLHESALPHARRLRSASTVTTLPRALGQMETRFVDVRVSTWEEKLQAVRLSPAGWVVHLRRW